MPNECLNVPNMVKYLSSQLFYYILWTTAKVFYVSASEMYIYIMVYIIMIK